jgi:hypothetical protein
MPSRWFCVVIIGFWLAANGWLVWREVLPALETGQPPPFTIDFLDEVEMDRPVDTAWQVRHNGREEYSCVTKVTPHKETDTFELSSRVRINRVKVPQPEKPRGILGDLLILEQLDSSYHVTRDGVLRETTADVVVTIDLPFLNWADNRLHAHIRGVVQDGLLHVHVQGSLPGQAQSGGFALDPVPVPRRGSILTPLHPVNRIRGLRPGQKWRQPLVNPLAGAVGRGRHRMLDAHVLPEPQILRWRGRDVPCLVIEYQDDDCHAFTWVVQTTGLVLRQDMTAEGDRLELDREH